MKVVEVRTSVVEKGQWGRELEVEIPYDRLEPDFSKAIKSYQKRLELPGFRKGKVPLNVVNRRFGDAIRGNVINDILPTLLEEATREAGLVPAAPPRIEKLDYEPGESLTFTATMDIWPEVEAEKYEGLEITKVVHAVEEEEVDKQLEEIRNGQAAERSVERPLETGDVLIADLQRLDDARLPIVGEKFEERQFLIGADDAPSPDFETAVIGISAGEERAVRFSYREDLPNEQLAGTEDHFLVTAREVRERHLPDLDDEMAKDVGDQFQTLEELRAHIRNQLEGQWEMMARQKMRADLTAELIKHNPFDLPESMLQNYLQSMRREREQARDGHDHDHDHDHDHGHDHDHDEDHEFSEEERAAAVRQLKGYILVEAVGKEAGVEVGEEEFEQHLQQRAERMGVDVEQLKRSARVGDLRRELRESKVFDLLAEKAKVKDETI